MSGSPTASRVIFLRRVEIAFHRGRGNEQQIRDVVEAAADVVRRQQQRIVHLLGQRVDREQIADGVLVLRAAQTMEQRQGAGMRRRGRGVDPGGFERSGDRLVGCLVRPRCAGRRHRARAQLADDLLPQFRVRARLVEGGRVDDQPRGFQPRVVTGDAVLREDGGGCRQALVGGACAEAAVGARVVSTASARTRPITAVSRMTWTILATKPRSNCAVTIRRQTGEPSLLGGCAAAAAKTALKADNFLDRKGDRL